MGKLIENTEGRGKMNTNREREGMKKIQLAVPVLDGSLAEYRPFLELLN